MGMVAPYSREDARRRTSDANTARRNLRQGQSHLADDARDAGDDDAGR